MDFASRFLGLKEEVVRQQRQFDRWKEQRETELGEMKANHSEELRKLNEQSEQWQARERRAQSQSAKLYKETQSEQENVQRLEEAVEQLRLRETELPRRREMLEKKVARQQAKVGEIHSSVLNRERALKSRLQELSKTIDLYKDRLGLDFHRGTKDNVLLFAFIYIDPRRPTREFSFSLAVDNEDVYHMEYCTPLVHDATLHVERLNRSNNFGQFILSMRRSFVHLAQASSD